MAKKSKQKYKVGDKVTSFLLKHSMARVKIHGVVKEVKREFGIATYIISEGVAEDFATRTVKLVD